MPSYETPLRELLNPGGQADYTFVGTASDGSTFGPGQKVVIGPFLNTNVGTSATTKAALPGVTFNPDSTGTAGYITHYGGKIMGVSCLIGTGVTAGTYDVYISKNGTTIAATKLSMALGAGNLKAKSVFDTDTCATFSAAQTLGITVKTNASTAPTTIEAATWIMLEM